MMKRSFAALLAHELFYDTLVFLRNPQSLFFTLGLPVFFLVIFASVFGNNVVPVAGGRIHASVYYVPNLIAFGVIAAAFVNLVISVTAAREAGIYKRRRATPVPAAVIIGGRALSAVAVALATTLVLLGIGWFVYGATFPLGAVPALIVDIVAGTLAFAALGYAVVNVVRDADAAQPVTQAIVLPLYFISGVFISGSLIPEWLTRIANYFPVRHLAQALLAAYNPYAATSTFAWRDLESLALWGAVGLFFAVRRFSWLPRSR
jgi:ABC-2 type transport system permease protein